FTDLLHNKLPLVDPELMVSSSLGGLLSENASYRARFLTRARKQGLAISTGPLPDAFQSKWRIWLFPGLGYAPVATLAIALLLVAVGVLGYSLRQRNARCRTWAGDRVAMSRQISDSTRPDPNPAQDTRSGSPSPLDAVPTPRVFAPSKTDAELVRARRDYAKAEARAEAHQEQLQTAMLELKTLGSQHEEASNSRDQLKDRLAQGEQDDTHVNAELQKRRQSRSDDAATIDAQALEIRKMS